MYFINLEEHMTSSNNEEELVNAACSISSHTKSGIRFDPDFSRMNFVTVFSLHIQGSNVPYKAGQEILCC